MDVVRLIFSGVVAGSLVCISGCKDADKVKSNERAQRTKESVKFDPAKYKAVPLDLSMEPTKPSAPESAIKPK